MPAGVGGFISFHLPRKRKISQWPKVILSHSKDISLHNPSFLLYNQFDKHEFVEVTMIETERLVLRSWLETDAESLYEYAKDPAVGPIAGWPVHSSVKNSLEIIKNVLSADETYAVCLKTDNVAIGSIGLITPAQTHSEASNTELEVGYWIGVPFWGNGYIPEAIRALQKHAFEDLGCTAMWCGYYDGNEKSRRCQEKCGFKYHHTEKNKPCELMSDVRTEHFTYLTKEEWKKR